MKRLFDVILSFVGLVCTAPIVLPVMFLVWWQDGDSPLYVAPRVGKAGKTFLMVKLRSMTKNADATGVDSTSATDRRITPVGRFVRRYKIDEITQLWNVLKDDMSLVGPRPNVRRETDMYTTVARQLLTVKPGITDVASIVFSDEGEILKDQVDSDIAYNQLIRTGKSMLGLFYVQHRSLWTDLHLCCLTAVAMLSRPCALAGVLSLLRSLKASSQLLAIADRRLPL